MPAAPNVIAFPARPAPPAPFAEEAFAEEATTQAWEWWGEAAKFQWELEVLSGTSIDSVIRHRAILAMAANQKSLNFAPGTDFRSSRKPGPSAGASSRRSRCRDCASPPFSARRHRRSSTGSSRRPAGAATKG